MNISKFIPAKSKSISSYVNNEVSLIENLFVLKVFIATFIIHSLIKTMCTTYYYSQKPTMVSFTPRTNVIRSGIRRVLIKNGFKGPLLYKDNIAQLSINV